MSKYSILYNVGKYDGFDWTTEGGDSITRYESDNLEDATREYRLMNELDFNEPDHQAVCISLWDNEEAEEIDQKIIVLN